MSSDQGCTATIAPRPPISPFDPVHCLLFTAYLFLAPYFSLFRLHAQLPDDLARERSAHAEWLASAPNSPLAAVARAPVDAAITLGPDQADVPLSGLGAHRLALAGGAIVLSGPTGQRTLARYRLASLGDYRLYLDGPISGPTVTVFGRARPAKPPSYFDYNRATVFSGPLIPPGVAKSHRILTLDGSEVEAPEAGSVIVPVGSTTTRLRVYRIPDPASEESELMIYFRDETNGQGSYPAGRFVGLVPLSDGRYQLDFNRARNPFCAYSSVYPCPAPWPGNAVAAPIKAGERYEGGGLENPEIIAAPDPQGSWKAVLDLSGGPLRFSVTVQKAADSWNGELCNGRRCEPFTKIRVNRDSVVLEMAGYAATIEALQRGDSLVGYYRNVGNRGPRIIPFRAARGEWPTERGPDRLLGRWDATYRSDWQASPRVFELRNSDAGLEGTIISNTGDYGHFWGRADADSFSLSHFDGSFVYMLTGRLVGDTLKGTFHAGLRSQTDWTAVRSTGRPHLKLPTEVTGADTSTPFKFSFPDLQGKLVTQADERFRGKVVLVDIFGSWCPTCHDAAPELVKIYREYHPRGLEIVGLAYEVTGDRAVDGKQVGLYRDKFRIPFPLLLAGINDTEAAAATQPQLKGFTSFPTTIFLGRDGKVKRVHAGFYGPATGAQHTKLIREYRREIERLLGEHEP